MTHEVCGVLRRSSHNGSDLAPYVVYPKEQGHDNLAWHIAGPGQSEVYPWASYEDAVAEVRRLQGKQS